MAQAETIVSGMAGRYALALFALAQEQNALDQVVADDEVISTALTHAAELAERLDPNAFALTRANCRGASLELIRSGLTNDIASFVVKIDDA